MRITRLILILFGLAACAARSETVIQWPTATTVRIVQATLVPTVDRPIHEINTPLPQNTPTAITTPDSGCQVEEGTPLVRHTVTADVNYAEHMLSVRQNVMYVNPTSENLNEIVLNVEPNLWPNAFRLIGIAVDGDAAGIESELTGRRLTVTLSEPLEPGCQLELAMVFDLRVPAVGAGVDAFKGYLGYSARQLNLGNWLPTVATRNNDEWITREAIFIGEQTVLDTADWDVTLNVTGASEALVVAGPGAVEQPQPGTWRFVESNTRDFTLSLSESFNIQTQKTPSGVTVELYSFDDAIVQHEGRTYDGATYALDVATQALGMYENLFGKYPYTRMLVVQGDFPDGMEFSSIAFVSTDWFRSWRGSPESYLMLITVHEIAHQWWYAKVGSDQAVTPWLDEALATYSEYIFIEEYYPSLKEWWWEFRVERYGSEDFVDSTVYEFESIREYINAVYLRGVQMLAALREDLGTEAFFAWLRGYAEAGSGRVATPALFWSLLNEDQLEATRETRELYLRQPGIDVGIAVGGEG
jgi:hypothetical protein